MLESTIAIAVYVAFLEALLYPLKENLKKSTSVEESVSIRRKMKWIRNISLFVFLILYLIIGPIMVAQVANIDFSQYWLKGSTPALGYLVYNAWQAFRQKNEDNPFRPISCKTKNDVLSIKEPYILYLRGFQNDNYNCKFQLELQGGIASFSEYNLVKEISDRIPVYTIGMTKEAYSPIGADRVYLDDLTWKNDVLELMIAAEKIVVLVDDKENCLWEIEQTNKLKKKTIYIVNDYYKYLMAKIKLDGKISFPPIEEEFQTFPFYISFENEQGNAPYIQKLTNYIDLANYITKTLPRKLSRIFIYCLRIGMISSFNILVVFTILHFSEVNQNQEMVIIVSKICASLSMISYIIANWLMLKRNKLGFYIFIVAIVLILLLGFIRDDVLFFIIAGVISSITIALMCLKSNKRNAFQILGIIR